MDRRPLLDRLHDIEHYFKLDGMPLLAADVELTRLQELTASVDVKVGEPAKSV